MRYKNKTNEQKACQQHVDIPESISIRLSSPMVAHSSSSSEQLSDSVKDCTKFLYQDKIANSVRRKDFTLEKNIQETLGHWQMSRFNYVRTCIGHPPKFSLGS